MKFEERRTAINENNQVGVLVSIVYNLQNKYISNAVGNDT